MIAEELDLHRDLTAEFIAYDPVEVVLERENRIETPDGGYKLGPPTNVPSQTFRLLPMSDVVPTVQTPDGFVASPTYVLLGHYDADMKQWDRFSLGGEDFQITSEIRPAHSNNVYEKKGDVVQR